MMHEKYNTLTYDGYLYGVAEEYNLKAVRFILGDIELAAPYCLGGNEASARCVIKDGRLFINYLKTYAPKGENLHLPVQAEVNEVESIAFHGSTFVKHIIDEVVCEEIDLFFPYTGTIVAHQYYVDEVEWGSKMHEEESLFRFCEGCLDAEKSIIQQSDEMLITQFCWDESKRCTAAGSKDGQSTSRRWYFVNPTGSCRQNEYLLNVHVNYCVSGRIEDEWLDEILSAEHPVLRFEHMDEIEPGTNEFCLCSSDLVCDFVRFLDVERLERVYDYIEFEKYADYPQKMLKALFADSKILTDYCSEDNLAKVIKILSLFVGKKMKLSDGDNYSKAVIDTLENTQIAAIIVKKLSCLCG